MDFCLLLLVSLALSLPFLLFRHHNKQVAKGEEVPPGPWKLPIIGNLHQFGQLPHLYFQQLSLRYGPLLFLRFGSTPIVVISSAAMAEKLFTEHDMALSDRHVSYAQRKLSYGCLDIAFSPYGECWRQLRRICTIELLSPKRVQSLRVVREEQVELLVASIKGSSSSGPVNLSRMLLSLVNDTVCQSAFGDKYGERDGDGSNGKLQEILARSQALLRGMTLADFFPWLQWVHRLSGLYSQLERNFSELDDIFNQVIQEHQDPNRTKSNYEDLVDVLLKVQNDPTLGGTPFTIDHIKGVLMDIFVAGTDPTAGALVWAMVELMRNPTAMQKAQQEVRKVCKKEKVEESDLHQLKFLKLVVKETLRLHPPAPLPAPRQTRDKCTVGKYTIPAKTVVFINARAIGLDEAVWVKPEEFLPERFLELSMVDYKGKHFEMVPFGVGRRGCPGICFAENLIEITLANLLHRFDWYFPPGVKRENLDMKEAAGLMSHKKTPFQLMALPYHDCRSA